MAKLQGKVAVISGGSSGIFLATAKRFVQEGAYVFIMGTRQAELDKAVAEIGKNVTAVRGDVSKLEDIDNLYAAVAAQNRKIDIIFANAGFVELKPTRNVTQEHFDKTFATNARGVYVRELQNLVERAVILSSDGVLPNPLSKSNGNPPTSLDDVVAPPPAPATFRDSQRALILQALQATGWVIGGADGAAARLGLKRTTLITKMKKLGISRPALQTDMNHRARLRSNKTLRYRQLKDKVCVFGVAVLRSLVRSDFDR